MNHLRRLLTTGLLVALLYSPLTGSALADVASLAATDRIDDIAVTVDGEQMLITVMSDAYNRNQWYYIPQAPRLAERIVDGNRVPEFSLIRYAFLDPDDRTKVISGGILTFSATLALRAQAIEQLRSHIFSHMQGRGPLSRKIKKASDIRVSALPVKSAKARVFTHGGDFVGSGGMTKGIAPGFATQKMSFTIPLTRIGADTYAELARSGILVTYEATYNGMTPKTGVTGWCDIRQAHEHFSSQLRVKASSGWLSPWRAKASYNRKTAHEELERAGVWKLDAIEGAGDNFDTIIDGLLTTISEQIVATWKEPEKIDPAKAGSPGGGGLFGGGGATYALKDISNVRRTRLNVNYTKRKIVEEPFVCSGLVGIEGYPPDVKAAMIREVPAGPWQTLYYTVPGVGDAPSLGVDTVDLEVALHYKGRPVTQQLAQWRRDADNSGAWSTPMLTFPLMGIRSAEGASQEDFTKHLRVVAKARVTLMSGSYMEVTQELPAIQRDSEAALVRPLSMAQVVQIDGTQLNWWKMGTGDIQDVEVRLECGDAQFSDRIAPTRVDGEWLPPKLRYWLVAAHTGDLADAEPVVASVNFKVAGERMRKAWIYSGEDLRIPKVVERSEEVTRIARGGTRLFLTIYEDEISP